MADGALSDVVVLELATGAAGPYAGKLLADLGAQVIKVEPPRGDWMRGEPPQHRGESGLFNYLNENKLGAAFEASDSRIDQLAQHADVVIHSLRGREADALEARLAAARPSAVVISLSPYGRSGSRSRWTASPLTEWATSGYQYIAGDPARAPLALPGFQAGYHAGLHAAVAALAGLWHARETGEGQRVEISHQEACLSDHAWVTTMWTHMGQVQRRTGAIYAKCLDGHIYMFNLAPYPNLFVLMERFDLLADEELLQPMNWITRFPEVFAALGEWAATKTRQEIYHAAQELRIAVSPVNTMEDVAENAQLAAREWFGTVEVGGETFQAPGFPYRLSETPCEQRTPAPKLGEHSEAVLDSKFGWANADVAGPTSTNATRGSGEGPLTGLRLVEVTANWAGPIGGRHFADLGADVIKIELQTKPATRALIYVGDDVTWPEHYHRSGYFNKLNRNKRAIALDLSKPDGREAFLRLVAKADCVLENNAARVMAQLGLGYEDLRNVNPALVMCSMSGFGSTGPERNYSAYGSNIETTSGLASLLGYGPGDRFGTGSYYADPVTGNHGSVAMLAALHGRRRTGRGQWIDMALLEAVGPFFAEQFLEYTVQGKVAEPEGDQWGRHRFQAVVPTAGKDCWLAVTCKGVDEVDKLRILVRAASEDSGELRRALEAWCAVRDHNSVAELFQSEGIAAAPVMANWEIYTDNHLNERGYFTTVRHEVAGTFQQPGFAWRFEATPATIRMAAPLFGEHNIDVFRDLIGLSSDEIDALYASGATGDGPLYATGPQI